MSVSYGWIGKKEIDEATEKLERMSYNNDKNIWIEKPHCGNYAKGKFFKKIEELLSENDFVETFKNLNDYSEFLEETETEPYQEILNILAQNKTAYCGFEREIFSENMEDVVRPLIEDGQQDWYMTFGEALEDLKSENPNETLVIWLLQ